MTQRLQGLKDNLESVEFIGTFIKLNVNDDDLDTLNYIHEQTRSQVAPAGLKLTKIHAGNTHEFLYILGFHGDYVNRTYRDNEPLRVPRNTRTTFLLEAIRGVQEKFPGVKFRLGLDPDWSHQSNLIRVRQTNFLGTLATAEKILKKQDCES